MPLKLNVALWRKVGEPNYGSRGATVGLEMEVDSTLIHQPRQLHQRIARLFRLARCSVDRELGGELALARSAHEGQPPRPATAAQIRAIFAIANRMQLNPVDEIRERFGLQSAEELSLEQASTLIDAIKPSANGTSAPSPPS